MASSSGLDINAIPFRPHQSQQHAIGFFSTLYANLSSQQIRFCIKCNAGRIGNINPEDLCAFCLVEKASLALSLHQESLILQDQRNGLLQSLVKYNSNLVRKFKTQDCQRHPNCDFGSHCIFLHPYDELADIQIALQPMNFIAPPPPSLPFSFNGVFSRQYADLAPAQAIYCAKCLNSDGFLARPNDMCIRCLVNTVNWANDLYAQNIALRRMILHIQLMCSSLDAMLAIKYKTKPCEVRNCVNPNCTYAHSNGELRQIHQPFDENLIAAILQDLDFPPSP